MIIAVLAAGAIACYVSVVIHTVALVRHRKPAISISRLLFAGYLFFTPETFQPSGSKLHRRFGLSVMGTLGFGALLILAAIIGD